MRISDWSSDVCSSDLDSGSHDSVAIVQKGIWTIGILIPTEIATQQGGPVFSRCLRLQIVWITGTNAPCYQGQCISFIPALRPQQRGLPGNLGDADLLPKLFDTGPWCPPFCPHSGSTTVITTNG